MKKRLVGVLAALFVIAFTVTAIAGALRFYHGYAKRVAPTCATAVRAAGAAAMIKPRSQCRMAKGAILGDRIDRTVTRKLASGACEAQAWTSVKCGF